MHVAFSILLVKVLILLKAFMNFKPKLPLAFSILLAKVVIFVKAFINFKPKFEDAFSVFNTFCKSVNFSNGIHKF